MDSDNADITELRLKVQLGPFAELRLGSRYLGVCKPKAHANQRDPQHYFFSYAISLYEYILHQVLPRDKNQRKARQRKCLVLCVPFVFRTYYNIPLPSYNFPVSFSKKCQLYQDTTNGFFYYFYQSNFIPEISPFVSLIHRD